MKRKFGPEGEFKRIFGPYRPGTDHDLLALVKKAKKLGQLPRLASIAVSRISSSTRTALTTPPLKKRACRMSTRNFPEPTTGSTGAAGKKIETNPGDVIIFQALAPHQSSANTSIRSHRQFYLTYNNGKLGGHYSRQQTHYRAYTARGQTEE